MEDKNRSKRSTGATGNLRKVRLGELFRERRQPGRQGLPTMSVTMAEGIVERESLDRRVTSDLRPEQHLLALKGDIAYNMMRMWQGVSGIVPYDCLVSPAYVVLEPLEGIIPEFAAYFLKSDSTIQKLHRFSQGLTGDRLRLYFEQFKDITVEIPDVATQTIAARILLAVDEAIEASQAVIKQVRQLKTALLQELLTKGLPGRHTRYEDRKGVGSIPATWHVRPLSDIAVLSSGNAVAVRALQTFPTHNVRVPVYGGNGIAGYTAKALVDNPTVVIGRVGEYCGAVHYSPEAAWISDNALYAASWLSPIDRKFLYYLLQYRGLTRYRSKTGQPLVTQGGLASVQVVVPEPAEQRGIVDLISAVEKREALEGERLISVMLLKSALGQGLMTGKIPTYVPSAKSAATQGRDARKARKD